MITVCIESPLAGDFAKNIAYARAALRYCLEQGVSPYASHLLLPQVFDDLDAEQRERGIAAGLAMGDLCEARWFFMDLGMSSGMQASWDRESERAVIHTGRYQQRFLGYNWRIRYSSTPTPGF